MVLPSPGKPNMLARSSSESEYDMGETVSMRIAREAAENGLIREAIAIPDGESGRFMMRLRFGMTEKSLRTANEYRVRTFATLDAVAKCARELGVPRIGVELVNWTPPQKAA